MKNLIILVNAVRDHKYIAGNIDLEYHDADLVNLWTNQEAYDHPLNVYKSNTIEELIYTEEALDLYVSNYNKVLAVIPSGDDSVELALKLQNKYNSDKSNSLETINIVKNKFDYLSHLLDSGVLKTKQFNLNEELTYPVVVKPKNYVGGGIGVYYVENNSQMPILDNNDDYFAQEYITGTEYLVDIVTKNKEHKLVGIYKYFKQDTHVIWRYKESLFDPSEDTALVKKIYDYVCRCLNEVDWNFGITSNQVIVSAENEVYLIETNFRKHGHIHDTCVKNSIGVSLFEEISNLYLSNVFEPTDTYSYNHPYERYWLNKYTTGKIEKFLILEYSDIALVHILNHQDFFDFTQEIQPSFNMFTSFGQFSFSHSDSTIYKNSIKKYLEWATEVTGDSQPE